MFSWFKKKSPISTTADEIKEEFIIGSWYKRLNEEKCIAFEYKMTPDFKTFVFNKQGNRIVVNKYIPGLYFQLLGRDVSYSFVNCFNGNSVNLIFLPKKCFQILEGSIQLDYYEPVTDQKLINKLDCLVKKDVNVKKAEKNKLKKEILEASLSIPCKP